MLLPSRSGVGRLFRGLPSPTWIGNAISDSSSPSGPREAAALGCVGLQGSRCRQRAMIEEKRPSRVRRQEV